MLGVDIGAIFGFANMSDFLARFGHITPVEQHYLSKTRTGFMVSIFNIGYTACGIFSLIVEMFGFEE